MLPAYVDDILTSLHAEVAIPYFPTFPLTNPGYFPDFSQARMYHSVEESAESLPSWNSIWIASSEGQRAADPPIVFKKKL